jgi:PAS domain S-box-containing protein
MQLDALTPAPKSRRQRPKRSTTVVGRADMGTNGHVSQAAYGDHLSSVAINVAHLGGWLVDLSKDTVYLSDEACDIHDLAAGATFVVADAIEFYAPESRPAIVAAFAALVDHGTPYDLELEIISATGRRVAVRTIAEAVRDANGGIVAVQGAFQDLSEIRAIERSLHQFSDAHYTLDRNWRFRYVNAEAERLLGYTAAELIGTSVWDPERFPQVHESIFNIEFHRAIETAEAVTFETYYAPLDLWCAVRAFPSDAGLAVYFQDISERRAIEEARAASEQRYRALFERAGDAIFIADDSGHFVDVNESAAILVGMPRNEMVGRRLNDFLADALEPVDADAAWDALRRAGEARVEIRLRRADGEVREIEYVAVPDVSAGLNLGVLRDVTDRLRHERAATERAQILQALRHVSPAPKPEDTAAAICQELVGNGDFLSAAIVAFDAEAGALALGAQFRDGRGLSALPVIDERVLDHLMSKAVLGPWIEDGGGPDGGRSRTSMASFGVFAAAFAPLEFDGRLVGLLSVGSTETPSDLRQRIPALMEFAALASSLLGPGLRLRSDRAAERARIRAIISTRAFHPVFQAIVDLESGEVVGYEALTRFADGTSPDVVFAQAATAGMSLALEAATAHAALEAAAPLPANRTININVSPDLILAREPLRTILRDWGFGVVLELTEHSPVTDYAAVRAAIADIGGDIHVAVDDAGAGFASLRHILELRPSMVKLDISLIRGINDDAARQALVAGMVHIAARLETSLLAEGVETAAEQATLVDLGVRRAQGYLFGRPSTVDELLSK